MSKEDCCICHGGDKTETQAVDEVKRIVREQEHHSKRRGRYCFPCAQMLVREVIDRHDRSPVGRLTNLMNAAGVDLESVIEDAGR